LEETQQFNSDVIQDLLSVQAQPTEKQKMRNPKKMGNLPFIFSIRFAIHRSNVPQA